MSAIDSVTLEVEDLAGAQEFHAAFGVGYAVGLRVAETPSDGFRAYTLSLVVSQPANAKLFFDAGVGAGATAIKPLSKSFWGYGGVLRAPDGAIWKVATSTKKDRTEPDRAYDDLVLLLGVSDVKATKNFYTAHGLTVEKSYANRYVQFSMPDSAVKLALYGRRALAKDAGVAPEGSGSHRIVIQGDSGAFSDPDGFAWETAPAPVR